MYSVFLFYPCKPFVLSLGLNSKPTLGNVRKYIELELELNRFKPISVQPETENINK